MGDELFEISELQYLKKRLVHPKKMVQYCDLPEVVELQPFKKYKRFDQIRWESPDIHMRLVCKPKSALWKLVQELILQNKIKDDRKWKVKRKLNLVAYILELAYNLGLLNSHSNLAKNESTRKNKQKESKDVDKLGDKESRKKTEVAEEVKPNRRRRVTRRSKTAKVDS